MDMYELITCRHSVRRYRKEQVSDDDIKKILDAGLCAPSGENSQPWHFTVIKSKSVQDELVQICKKNFQESNIDWRKNWSKMDNFNPFYDPSIIIVVSNKNSVKYSNEDCCFAIQNMVLMAESLGLSSCIIRDICYAIDKSNQSRFGVPEGFECFMCISIGYAELKNKNKKLLDYSKVNYVNQ